VFSASLPLGMYCGMLKFRMPFIYAFSSPLPPDDCAERVSRIKTQQNGICALRISRPLCEHAQCAILSRLRLDRYALPNNPDHGGCAAHSVCARPAPTTLLMNRKLARLSIFTLCLASVTALTAHAEQLPLWEAGAGVAAIKLPDYRGSDVSSTYALPVPYLIYRGEFLKADRNGVRSTLFDNDKLEVNISVNGTLPVNSKDNTARRGMSDLKPAVEIGPTVSVNLWNSADNKTKLDFRAPLRTAVTIESSPRQIGWLFSPNLHLDIKDPAGMTGWNLGMLAGPYFQTRKYNSYFYTVSAAEATATRPAYSAPGGYAGSQFTLALSKRFPRYWVGGFLRYDTLSGAVFQDSPLVKKNSAVSAGIAISWIFGQSSKMVNVEDRQ